MAVKIHVTYCRLRGFDAMFDKFVEDFEAIFPGKIEITGKTTPSRSGYFEVEVNGKLVHSRKDGDGFVFGPKTVKSMVEAINQAMV